MAQTQDSHTIITAVRAAATPMARALGLELVDVQCLGQGARMLLRVTIDKPEGVNVEDCEQLHISLSRALDLQDPIPHTYTLEVSSPGLDRPLKDQADYEHAVGKLVNLKLRQPINSQWRLTGRIVETNDHGLQLALQGANRVNETVLVQWESIAQGRLDVEFPRPRLHREDRREDRAHESRTHRSHRPDRP